MNNRIEEFVSPRKPASSETGPAHRPGIGLTGIDLKGSMTVVTEWAAQHPVACLAAAFVFGGVVKWIIKRR